MYDIPNVWNKERKESQTLLEGQVHRNPPGIPSGGAVGVLREEKRSVDAHLSSVSTGRLGEVVSGWVSTRRRHLQGDGAQTIDL